MGYKDEFKIGDIVSICSNIEDAVNRGALSEVIGYKNIKGLFHIKTQNISNGFIQSYPVMFGHYLTNYGKKQIVELLWRKK